MIGTLAYPQSFTLANDIKTYLSENVVKVRSYFADGLEGTMRITGVAENTAKAVRYVFPNSPYVGSMPETLSQTGEWLGIVDLINVSWFWYDWKHGSRKTWQHTTSFICTTARSIIGSAKYVSSNYSAIAATVGRFPVVNITLNTLRVTGFSLAIWHQYINIQEADRKIDNVRKTFLTTSLATQDQQANLIIIEEAKLKKIKAKIYIVHSCNQIAMGLLSLAVICLAVKIAPAAMLAFSMYTSYFGCFMFFYNNFKKPSEPHFGSVENAASLSKSPSIELGPLPAKTKLT